MDFLRSAGVIVTVLFVGWLCYIFIPDLIAGNRRARQIARTTRVRLTAREVITELEKNLPEMKAEFMNAPTKHGRTAVIRSLAAAHLAKFPQDAADIITTVELAYLEILVKRIAAEYGMDLSEGVGLNQVDIGEYESFDEAVERYREVVLDRVKTRKLRAEIDRVRVNAINTWNQFSPERKAELRTAAGDNEKLKAALKQDTATFTPADATTFTNFIAVYFVDRPESPHSGGHVSSDGGSHSDGYSGSYSSHSHSHDSSSYSDGGSSSSSSDSGSSSSSDGGGGGGGGGD
jgi:hypothetical protein